MQSFSKKPVMISMVVSDCLLLWHGRDARMLCMASSDIPKPEINLHKIMKEISSGRGGRWDQKVAYEEGAWNEVSVRLEKKEIQEVCVGVLHTSIWR